MKNIQVKYQFLLFSLFFILFIVSCKKDHLENINPTTHVSELSRALLINGANIKGDIEFETSTSNLDIVSYQTSASITGDNYLFVPFVYQSNGDAKHVFFYIEGADNFWKIPIEETNDKVLVLNIGIPENVSEGDMTITYGLLDSENRASTPVNMAVNVVLPEDYCEGGNSLGYETGEDGLTVRTYQLGEKAGWVSIDFDTYIIPDRVDIRYGNVWIRSTGKLLTTGGAPPIKPCDQAGNDDGFVGLYDSFSFYYDPEISRKVDIYVSGCLGGGTLWEFKIVECPKEKPVLGVHSYPDDGTFANQGHSWITFTENNVTTTYSLWPDWNDDIEKAGLDNGDLSDVRVNFSKDFYLGNDARYYPLKENQVELLESFVNTSQIYSLIFPTNVCTSFAQQLVYDVTGELIESDDIFQGSAIETPRKMSESIRELEAKNPTNTYVPEGLSKGSSSCSFCL